MQKIYAFVCLRMRSYAKYADIDIDTDIDTDIEIDIDIENEIENEKNLT